MSSELLGKFMAKFDAADEQKKGSLDKTQFAAVLKQLMDASDETVELYFHGLDVCNNNTVSRDEFESFVKACLTRDPEYTFKLGFRGFDKNRSRTLGVSEILALAKYTGSELTEEEARLCLKRTTGKEDGEMTYAMLVKILTGKEVADDADPYDGKLK